MQQSKSLIAWSKRFPIKELQEIEQLPKSDNAIDSSHV